MNVEKISAITIKVNDMARSVQFYNKLLGLKVLYGGESAYFSSLQTLGAKDTILNLEKAHVTPDWGRIIFYVEDVDRFLGSPERERIQSRKAPRCSMGRKVLLSARSRRPRTVICPANPLRLPGSFAISTNC